jgi:hypothetical protein
MKTWTKQAEERLEEYLGARARREGLEGNDAKELRDDLKAHMHEEAGAGNAGQIGVAELEQMIGKLEGREPEEWEPREVPKKGSKKVMFFGVILPVLVILLEVFTGFCGGAFFDPVPTFWHAILLISVPVLNFWLLKKGGTAGSREQGIAAGVMLIVAGFYGLLFVPLLPLSIPAVVVFGMGFLSLSPILAFWAGWKIVGKNREKVAQPWLFRQGLRIGAVAAIFALLALEVPGLWTRVQLERAVSDEAETEEAGVAALRMFHSERTLLRSCYERGTMMSGSTDISGWIMNGWKVPMAFLGESMGRQGDRDRMREVFFRATGKPFNSIKPPRLSTGGLVGSGRGNDVEELEFDDALGGDQVAMRLKNLELAESRFDGHADSISRIGYGEWTMVFKNSGMEAKEARCQVRLPRGGKVSRLTLWVEGEPREAAFSSVSKVKAAYQEVAVVQRRDPVLVTMAGPDTVLVQCFPVPARGEMKIRFGITAPLDGELWDLPRVVERNFGVRNGAEHSMWMQADREFTCSGAGECHKDGEGFSATSSEELEEVLESGRMLQFDGLAKVSAPVWCEDRFAEGAGKYLERRIEKAERAGVDRLVVVVDGSVSMADDADMLAEIFEKFPESDLEVIIADDEVRPVGRDGFGDYQFTGGRDNGPALRAAISKAKEGENGAVVWLHGPQAVDLAETEALLQLLERGTQRVQIHDMEMAYGPNRLSEALGKEGLLERGPTLYNKRGQLENFFRNLLDGGRKDVAVWTRSESPPADGATKVWDHLARIWAMEKSESNDPDRAKIAAAYQLVTPVSGAVVLETIEQFRRHGLEPVDGSGTPAVPALPEPSTGLLVMLAASAALLRRRREPQND